MSENEVYWPAAYAEQVSSQRRRVRVKARLRYLVRGVPNDARPGDLVLGNRGAAAEVYEWVGQFGSRYLALRHVGNYGMGVVINRNGRVYDFR